MRIPKKEWERIWKTIQCNCGHLSKDHYLGEGFCDLCACTWYWPNDKYILRYKKKAEKHD